MGNNWLNTITIGSPAEKKEKNQLLSCILCFLGSLISYEQTGHGANYRPHLCWEL